MKLPLIERFDGLTDTSNPVHLDTPVVPPGELWEFEFVSVSNHSGEVVTVALVIGAEDSPPIVSNTASVADTVAYISDILPLLREGQFLRAWVIGVAAKGLIILCVTGWRHVADPPG